MHACIGVCACCEQVDCVNLELGLQLRLILEGLRASESKSKMYYWML